MNDEKPITKTLIKEPQLNIDLMTKLKLYYLGTCTTSARIMKEVNVKKFPFEIQEIKTQPITEKQIDEMRQLAGGYEALFSRVALKYRGWGLNNMKLTEPDYRKYILQEYTFLKRPVFIIGNEIFIGNAPKTVDGVLKALKNVKHQ